MRNVLRIAAIAIAFIGGADLAMAQSTPNHGVVTGTQQNERQVFGTGTYGSGFRGYHHGFHAFARMHRWHRGHRR